MFYCLNLASTFDNFRLKKDGSWKRYEGPKLVSEDDFVTSDPNQIIALQKQDFTLELAGKQYLVEPATWSPARINQMSYQCFGYHTEFPILPTRSQFDATLVSGDDNERNRLVLRIDGKFDLLSGRSVFLGKNELQLVSYLSAFGPEGGYVGPNSVTKDYTQANEVTFNEFMVCWIKHLKQGTMAQYIDDYNIKLTSEEIQHELKVLENNWHELSQAWTS